MAQQDSNETALHYYHPAFNYFNDGLNNESLCEVTLGMAKVYEKLNQQDSAAFFGNMSFYHGAIMARFISRAAGCCIILKPAF
ncbi:MAG: hypothetical protein WDM90_19995 [Ferruginibacter sp.]